MTAHQVSKHYPFKKNTKLSFIYVIIFICLFLVVLGLHCVTQSSLVGLSDGYSLVAVHRLLIAVDSLVAEHRL